MAIRLIWDPQNLPRSGAEVKLKQRSPLAPPAGIVKIVSSGPLQILAVPPRRGRPLDIWWRRILTAAAEKACSPLVIRLPQVPALLDAAQMLRELPEARKRDIVLDVQALVPAGAWEMLDALEEHLADEQGKRTLSVTADINGLFPGMMPPSPASARRYDAAPGSLEDWITKEEAGFSETLLGMIDAAGKKDSDVYARANVSRQHFSKIRNNPDYRPTKQTAVAFAIALELDLDQTQQLLGSAGYVLNRSSKFDLIILYFLNHKNYDLAQINIALLAFDQKLLGM